MTEFNEEVPLMYSNEKLKMLLEESGLPVEEVFKSYIQSLNYEAIKDFPQGTSWFNTKEPLSFKKHLKGKLVLLDFFTYCCINCMHILPDLKEIEHTFSIEDGLVVIGVHSAKFDNEKQADNVKNAVLRYNIEHAVVNDEGARMWKQCDIHCWPSLLLISPEGQPLVLLMGEGHRDTLKLYIKHFLAYFKERISPKSLPITKTADVIQHQEPLLFPGKIKCFENRLCISDSGNNRLIFVDNFDQVEKKVVIVGSPCGEIGFHDGGLTEAMFNQPQGICFLNKDVIFVADTENHAIRRVDLRSLTVSTIAGNGVQSNDRNGGRIGTQQGISSPWDLEMYTTDDGKPVILVAMAGMHQIWAVFLEDTKWWKGKEYMAGMVVCVAGSGREENRNNNYPNNAAFAQPSGLALMAEEKWLFIADSESSTVRKLDLKDGRVSAVVGGDKNPNNLFAFGDQDGVAHDAKLQHCLGVAIGNVPNFSKKLFIADTYNHKIKVVDTLTNQCKTLKSPTKFNEPCGLLQTPDGKLYVADTNAHQIKVCTLNEDLSEILSVNELKLENVDLLQPTTDAIDTSDVVYSLPAVYLPILTSSDQKSKCVQVSFGLKLVDDLHFNEEAPQKWRCTTKNDYVAVAGESSGTGKENIQRFSLELHSNCKQQGNQDVVNVHFQVFTCLGDLCFNKRFIVRIPVSFVAVVDNKMADVNASVVIGRDNVKVSTNLT